MHSIVPPEPEVGIEVLVHVDSEPLLSERRVDSALVGSIDLVQACVLIHAHLIINIDKPNKPAPGLPFGRGCKLKEVSQIK